MKNMIYVAANLQTAITFIKFNTDWKQVTNVCFINGDEKIIVIDNFMRFRGRQVDGVYIDYSFRSIRDDDYTDFRERFELLGITPIEIKER